MKFVGYCFRSNTKNGQNITNRNPLLITEKNTSLTGLVEQGTAKIAAFIQH